MLPQNLVIKKALVSDYNDIAAISSKTFFETFSAVNTAENMENYLHENFNVEQVKKELENSSNVFLIALIGHEIIGYVKLKNDNPPEELKHEETIEVERIYVLKKYHDLKIGFALMQQCIEEARHRNCKSIWLGVWEHNPKALAFYNKWGFETFGSHIFKLGDDLQTDFLMRKKI